MPDGLSESLLRHIDPSGFVKELLKNDIRADGRAASNIRAPAISIGRESLEI